MVASRRTVHVSSSKIFIPGTPPMILSKYAFVEATHAMVASWVGASRHYTVCKAGIIGSAQTLIELPSL